MPAGTHPPRRGLLVTALFALAAAVVLFGCGGSDDASTVASQPKDQQGSSAPARGSAGKPEAAREAAKRAKEKSSPRQGKPGVKAGGSGAANTSAADSCQELSREECAQIAR